MSRGCPRPERLARVGAGEADGELAAHVAACAACAAAVAGDRALIDLLRATPAPRLDAARRASLSAMVLSAPDTEPPRRSRLRSGAAVAIVFAAAAGFVAVGASEIRTARRARVARASVPVAPGAPAALPTPLPAPPAAPDGNVRAPGAPPPTVARAGAVHASPGARYRLHHTAGDALEVRLEDGAVTIDGRDGAATSVVVGPRRVAASPEAHYAVDARDGSLHTIQVFAGSVEVVGAGRAAVITAGETWALPAPEPVPAPEPMRATAATRPRGASPAGGADRRAGAPSSPSSSAAATAASSAFRDAWAALDAGQFAAAIAAFELAAAEPSFAEDAIYWGAIARARAGDTAGARGGLDSFLARFPRSPHVGAAHLTHGRQLADQPTRARRHLEAAAADPDPRVSAAARAALAAP